MHPQPPYPPSLRLWTAAQENAPLYYDWTFGGWGVKQTGGRWIWDSLSRHVWRNLLFIPPNTAPHTTKEPCLTPHRLYQLLLLATPDFQSALCSSELSLLIEWTYPRTGSPCRGSGGTAMTMSQNVQVLLTQSGSNSNSYTCLKTHARCAYSYRRALVHFCKQTMYLLACSGMRGKVDPYTCFALVWCKRVWRFVISELFWYIFLKNNCFIFQLQLTDYISFRYAT